MKRKMTLVLCALAVASMGFAQQQGGFGGPPPQQGGFPGGGQPQMRMGMGQPMGPNLLMSPDVQQELKLSDDQKAKLGQLFPRRQMGGPGGPPPQGGFGGPPPGGGQAGPGGPPPQGGYGGPPPGGGQAGPGGPPRQGGFGGPPQGAQAGGFPPRQGGLGGPGGNAQMEQQRAQMEAKIKQILSPEQYARYQELVLQQRGAIALGDPKVAAKVGLSDDQVDKIHEIMESNRPTPPPGGNGGPPDFDQMRKQMEAHKARVEGEILATLSGDQKATWQKMLGKPFAFKRQGPPPGGPGGGGGQD